MQSKSTRQVTETKLSVNLKRYTARVGVSAIKGLMELCLKTGLDHVHDVTDMNLQDKQGCFRMLLYLC